MSLTEARGDIFRATAQTLGFGLNASGRLDVSPLHTTLLDRYPVFVSEYRQRGRTGQLTPGMVWVWRESQPWLMALIVRETPQGPARLRYVESALLYLHHNWQREKLLSLALARFAEGSEWLPARELIAAAAQTLPIPIVIYGDDPLDGSVLT